MNIWDVGGQKSIRTYWRNYFESTDGIIWVVDSVDPWRLEECRTHLKDILSQEKVIKLNAELAELSKKSSEIIYKR